jgi:hypothetical protein
MEKNWIKTWAEMDRYGRKSTEIEKLSTENGQKWTKRSENVNFGLKNIFIKYMSIVMGHGEKWTKMEGQKWTEMEKMAIILV